MCDGVALQTRNTPSSDCSGEPELGVLLHCSQPGPRGAAGQTAVIINIMEENFLGKVAEFVRDLAEVSVVNLPEVLPRIHQVSGLVDGGAGEKGGYFC